MNIFNFFKKNEQSDAALAGVLPKDIENASVMTLEDVIAPSAIGVTPQNLNISGKLVRTFFAISSPRYLNDGRLEPVLNLEKYLMSLS